MGTISTPQWFLAIDPISGGVQQLSNPTDPFHTNFVINATTQPSFNVTDSRWLGDLIFNVRPAGSSDGGTEMTSGLSGDIRTIRQNGNAVTISYNGSAVNGNGFHGFNVDETWSADNDVLAWTTTVRNTGSSDLEFLDVGFPLLMNSYWYTDQTDIYTNNAERHSFIGENGSFIYWGRPNGVAPFLLMTMGNGTSLEYKNKAEPNDGVFGANDPHWEGLQEFYVHSASVSYYRSSVSGTYLPATSVVVPAGKSQTFSFNFRWPKSFSSMHDMLYASGGLDSVSLPGMTVPTDTTVTLALRSQGGIQSVVGETGKNVAVSSAGQKNGYSIYTFKLPAIGPNKITVTYGGNGKTSVMQYNSISPVNQLITSNAAFLVSHQQAHTSHSYNGAFLQYDMAKKMIISYDNYPGGGWEQWMAGGSDDLGLSPAEFLSEKNWRMPNQTEITALDLWIDSFILGYLQSAKNSDGTRSWAVYRWYDGQDGTPSDTGTWRAYNYVHVFNTYFNMYRIKKAYPTAVTTHNATDYLNMCYQTINAMFQFSGADDVGLMGEGTYPEILAALQTEKMTSQYNNIMGLLTNKYNSLNSQTYPFASEITIDTTGFETSYTLGKMFGNQRLQDKVQNASVISRGYTPAWYWYGSDSRSMGESWWNLGYETQIGAWVQQEYLLGNSPADQVDQLRSTFGAYLAGWSNINTGQIVSDPEMVGAASWIYQSQLGSTCQYYYIGLANGWWTWSGEASLGFWGGLRTASVGLVKDPIVGLYAYNGGLTTTSTSWTITPKDGIQQRIILWNAGKVDIRVANSQYTSATISTTLSSISLTLQPPSIRAANTQFTFARLPAGKYAVTVSGSSFKGTMSSDGSNASITIPAVTSVNTMVKFTKQ